MAPRRTGMDDVGRDDTSRAWARQLVSGRRFIMFGDPLLKVTGGRLAGVNASPRVLQVIRESDLPCWSKDSVVLTPKIFLRLLSRPDAP